MVKGTIDTYASSSNFRVMYSISGLANGNHTLTIEVTGTHGAASAGSWIWLDSFPIVR